MIHTSSQSKPEKILITAALPYANGAIHFGHLAGAYLPADVYARFMRLLNKDVCFICGSDEYGVAIALSAEQKGRTPQEHVDIFHEVNKRLFNKLGMSFDHYSRTTAKNHAKTTVDFFWALHKKGLITPMESEQLYSIEEDRFYADRYVVGTCPKCGHPEARGDECTKCGASYEATDLINPRAKIGNKPLTKKKTVHWYLRLDLCKDRLNSWIESKATWKPNVVNFIKSYISDLRPRAITRDMQWGIPVPLDEAKGKVFYVWFDAPIGYISATKEWAEQVIKTPDRWKDFWLDEKAKLVQFVGKDNIPFHAVVFPSMIMGQDLPYKLVDELPANEFYTLEGKQFSKSEGWYIDLEEFLKEFSPELIRYAILANAPETQDSEFTWKDFQLKVNSDLVGKFGNFINRTLVFAKNMCNGEVPSRTTLDEVDVKFLETMKEKAKGIAEAYSGFKVRRACQIIMEIAQAGNIYFDTKKPWTHTKEGATEKDKESMRTTISLCLECVKLLSVVSSPVLPETSKKIEAMIVLESDEIYSKLSWDEKIEYQLQSGSKLLAPSLLFTKIEDEVISKHEQALHALSVKTDSNKESNKKPMTNSELPTQQAPTQEQTLEQAPQSMISFDEFQKIELEVVEIVACEAVPKSKKLLRLEVMTKRGKRQILSGIALSFKPEDLIGKKVVAVVNLKPTKIMGLESQGMILAASDEANGLELLEMKKVLFGSSVG